MRKCRQNPIPRGTRPRACPKRRYPLERRYIAAPHGEKANSSLFRRFGRSASIFNARRGNAFSRKIGSCQPYSRYVRRRCRKAFGNCGYASELTLPCSYSSKRTDSNQRFSVSAVFALYRDKCGICNCILFPYLVRLLSGYFVAFTQ